MNIYKRRGHSDDESVDSLARKVAAKMKVSSPQEAMKDANLVGDAYAIVNRQSQVAALEKMLTTKDGKTNVDNSQTDTDGDTTNVDDSGQGELCPECITSLLDSTGTCPECGYIKTNEGKQKKR
jgi:hypothetical protein